MIDRKITIEYRGYDPDDLSVSSNKLVWRICDSCGSGKWLAFRSVRNLCLDCSNHNPERAKKISKSLTGDKHWNHSSDGVLNVKQINARKKQGKSLSLYHKENPPSDETNLKRSESLKEYCRNPLNSKKRSEIQIKRHKDKPLTEDQKENQRQAQLKRYKEHPVTDITRQRSSESHIKYYQDHPEAILRGKNHPCYGKHPHNWDGGISFDPYCEKFNEKKKNEIRNKYGNCDYLTGIHCNICNKDKNGKIWKLSVHHVDYNKMQGCNDVKWKLIPVSARHNSMFNKNRSFWEKLILYALEYDKIYYKNKSFNIFGGISDRF